MKNRSADTWINYGKDDPYFGVLSDEKYRNRNLNQEVLDEFFATGKTYVKETEDRVYKQFGTSLKDCSILDFGCGVGRLAIPFAQATEKEVVGIDISKDILIKAKEHADAMACTNLEFIHYNGRQLPFTSEFDFVNSYIVLQHIEPVIGYQLIQQLIEKVKIGGILQIQVTYGNNWPRIKYSHYYLRSTNAVYNFIYSSLKNRKLKAEPVMQMNPYKPDKLFKLFSQYASSVQVEFTDHTGFLGASYLLKKEREI
jgi:2-polyprenyl-3-methyl-5-hydroxy-6-metoxy-1,4-benzoquinol methylase